MPKTFKLELTFVLTEEQQQKLVDSARLLYAKEPPAFEFEGHHLGREVSADEAITNAASALTYVAYQNAVLEELDIQAEEIFCTDPGSENTRADESHSAELIASGGAADSETIEDEMDEWDHGLCLCRWPNGEFAIVNAERPKLRERRSSN